MTPFQSQAQALLRKREQATTPEAKAEAERELAELIQQQFRGKRLGGWSVDVKQRQVGGDE